MSFNPFLEKLYNEFKAVAEPEINKLEEVTHRILLKAGPDRFNRHAKNQTIEDKASHCTANAVQVLEHLISGNVDAVGMSLDMYADRLDVIDASMPNDLRASHLVKDLKLKLDSFIAAHPEINTPKP